MQFYSDFLQFDERRTSGSQHYAICPMHSDTNASLTVNAETGEWYCHGCGKGGKYVEFLESYFDVGVEVARKQFTNWEKRHTFLFPTEKYVTECYERLKSNERELRLLKGFGITDEIIDQFKLGLDDIRITIPIYSKTNMLVNVRKYLPPHRRIEGSNNAKVINSIGCGESRLYPLIAFNNNEPLYIVEGEKDCLVARSQGLNAVTGTGGSTIPTKELYLFTNKKVYLMTDTDSVGIKIRKQYLRELSAYTSDISIVELPNKDFTDFWMQNKTIDLSSYIVKIEAPEAVLANTEVESKTLSSSESIENLNTWIKLEKMSVIGSDPKVYSVPCKLNAVCMNGACDKPCPYRSIKAKPFDVDARQILSFIDSSDKAQDTYVRKLVGCKHVEAQAAEYVNAQKILFQESASFIDGMEEASFEPRYGIFLYDETRLMPTAKYDFETTRVTDPRSQQNYYIIKKATAISQGTASGILNENTIEYFKEVAQQCGSVQELLSFHYEQWKYTLGVEGRLDLFGALLFTYLSATELNWNNGVLKGWLDCMVIGDTRTGKSQMSQRFIKAIEMGSYINGENARRTGVVGGVQKYGESWVITWGAIPMNDRGLLIIDEASGLSVDDIKELSSTRSSGAVTINKIAKGEARARTRLFWLSNPRSGRNLDDFYWKGFGAFLEYIPIAEDQARYDLVLTAAKSDVEKLEGIKALSILDVEKYKELITYMWCISKDDILIPSETAEVVKHHSWLLEDQYGGGPLVIGVAVHEKIIRLATAIAALSASINDNKLIVRPLHIDYATDFLRMTYDKKSLGYKEFIQESKRGLKAKEDNIKYIRELVGLYGALKVLLSSNQFRGGQVVEILGVDRVEGSKIISELLKRGLLKIAASGAYIPDKLLVEITKQMEVNF